MAGHFPKIKARPKTRLPGMGGPMNYVTTGTNPVGLARVYVWVEILATPNRHVIYANRVEPV